MQERLRSAGRRLAPGWAAARARRYEQARRRAAGIPQLATRVMERIGDRVINGPCAGLRFPPGLLTEIDAPVAKLVGSYEAQLHEPLASALDAGRSPFVDVGCADGYYAVGLALRRPELDVHAYDLAQSARSSCSAMAAFNGRADQVHIHRRCDTRQLQRLPLDDALVLADIEGAEFELFSEEMVSLLGGALVIVELHRPADDPAALALVERFAPSHRAEHLAAATPGPDALSALSFLTAGERATATSEGRGQGDQTWLVLTPRSITS